MMGRQHVQAFAILMKLLGPVTSKIGQGFAFGDGLPNRFIIHIGQVANMIDRLAFHFQHTPQSILQEEGTTVADMCRSINRRTAAIETNDSRGIFGDERFPFSSQCVVENGVHESEAGEACGFLDWRQVDNALSMQCMPPPPWKSPVCATSSPAAVVRAHRAPPTQQDQVFATDEEDDQEKNYGHALRVMRILVTRPLRCEL